MMVVNKKQFFSLGIGTAEDIWLIASNQAFRTEHLIRNNEWAGGRIVT